MSNLALFLLFYKITQKVSQQTTANIFRLGKISVKKVSGGTAIEDLYELYPWRIGDSKASSNIYTIDSAGDDTMIDSLYVVPDANAKKVLPADYKDATVLVENTSDVYTLDSNGTSKLTDSLYVAPNGITLSNIPSGVSSSTIIRPAIPTAPIVMATNASGTSFTANNGAYVELRTAGNITLYSGTVSAKTFTNFVGVMFIPPGCTVSCTTTMYYRSF